MIYFFHQLAIFLEFLGVFSTRLFTTVLLLLTTDSVFQNVFDQWFLNFHVHQNYLELLLNTDGPHNRNF